jgi:hypothetical protein
VEAALAIALAAHLLPPFFLSGAACRQPFGSHWHARVADEAECECDSRRAGAPLIARGGTANTLAARLRLRLRPAARRWRHPSSDAVSARALRLLAAPLQLELAGCAGHDSFPPLPASSVSARRGVAYALNSTAAA